MIQPNTAQAKFLADRSSRSVSLCGDYASGKTWGGAHKLVDLHLINSLSGQISVAIAGTMHMIESSLLPALRIALQDVNARFTQSRVAGMTSIDVLLGDRIMSPIYVIDGVALKGMFHGRRVGALWLDDRELLASDVAEKIDEFCVDHMDANAIVPQAVMTYNDAKGSWHPPIGLHSKYNMLRQYNTQPAIQTA